MMLLLLNSNPFKICSKIYLIFFVGIHSFAQKPAKGTDLNSMPFDQGLVALKSEALLPRTLVHYDNTKYIGQSLVRRIFEKYEKEAQTHPNQISFSFYQNAQIQLAFPAAVINSIRKYGFLNQHQIPASTGFYDPQGRGQVEDNLADLQLENSYSWGISSTINFLRPKYAYLALREPLHNFKPQVDSHHGNIFAVLKNEVKARSTISPMDSFKLDSVPSAALNSVRATFYSTSVSSDFIKYASHSGYWEVQIWGALSFEDVDYFLVNCGTQTLTQEQLKNVLSAAQSGIPKIPVYSCGVNYSGGALKPGWEILRASSRLGGF